MANVSRENAPGRLVPQRSLPPYSYVTGRYPHPTSDTQGHSFGASEAPAALPSPAAWRECEAYLWGIDLFNAGFYWESHESWEAVWHAVGRRGVAASFLKALIKLAAAGVKAREGRTEGVRRHASRAGELLEEVVAEGQPVPGEDPFVYMGLEVRRLQEAARLLQADPAAIVEVREAPVWVVMPFSLQVVESDSA